MKHKTAPLSKGFIDRTSRMSDIETAIIEAIDTQRGVHEEDDVYPGVIRSGEGFRCTRKRVETDREYAYFDNLDEAMTWVKLI